MHVSANHNDARHCSCPSHLVLACALHIDTHAVTICMSRARLPLCALQGVLTDYVYNMPGIFLAGSEVEQAIGELAGHLSSSA